MDYVVMETDYELLVTVRVYGPGSGEDAAQALIDHPATFNLPPDTEVEILKARPIAAGDESGN